LLPGVKFTQRIAILQVDTWLDKVYNFIEVFKLFMPNPTSSNKGPETLSSSPEVSSSPKVEHKDSKEIKEARISNEAVNTVEGAEITSEAAEAVNERISESVAKGKDLKGDGVAAGGVAAIDPAQLKAQLLKNLPNEKKMKAQIESEIKKEIKYLHKKALKMIGNPSNMSFFEMANILKKIRELRGILCKLAKASFEALKTMWLRFVHGIIF